MIARFASTQSRAVLVGSAIVVCIAGVLPPYLVAALSTQLSHDLHINLARIGVAGAAFFGTSALSAQRSGKLVHRFGSSVGLATALCFSIASYIVISVAHSYPLLLVGLTVGGIGNATAQPAANLRVVELIGGSNLGFALGIKQAAIPAATLLCGIAASVVADSTRWRIAFWVSTLGATCTLILLAARRNADREAPRRSADPVRLRPPALPGLIVMAAGGAMAAAASAPLGLFVVPSALGAGMPTRWAGALFAISSILGIGTRVGLGWSADHSVSRSPAVALSRLLMLGTVGYLLLGLGSEAAIVAGCLVGYGAGWTWPGLLHLLAVRSSREYAAWSTGLIQTGLSFGAAVGPIMFGIVADHESLRWAWLMSAVLSVSASRLIGSDRVVGGG